MPRAKRVVRRPVRLEYSADDPVPAKKKSKGLSSVVSPQVVTSPSDIPCTSTSSAAASSAQQPQGQGQAVSTPTPLLPYVATSGVSM